MAPSFAVLSVVLRPCTCRPVEEEGRRRRRRKERRTVLCLCLGCGVHSPLLAKKENGVSEQREGKLCEASLCYRQLFCWCASSSPFAVPPRDHFVWGHAVPAPLPAPLEVGVKTLVLVAPRLLGQAFCCSRVCDPRRCSDRRIWWGAIGAILPPTPPPQELCWRP